VSRLRRSYHHGDLRSALLDEVGHIIREQGVGVVSVREVARRASVSHGAPAHHFGNKSGLLTAFAVQGFEQLALRIETALAAARPAPPQQLAAIGKAYVLFAVNNPQHFEVMFPGTLIDQSDEAYVQASERCRGPLIAIVTRAAKEGYVDGDPRIVGAAAWSLVHGLASLWPSGQVQMMTGSDDAERVAEAITRLFVTKVLDGRR